uniref:Uncharacterized protein n=1 Tax=Haplochromis burtoni TaxID=8153 RepID=A0A3Q2V126_HAPBU
MRSVHLCSSSFSSSFIFLVLFSVICSQISTCNVRSRSPHSSESFKNRPTRTRGATQRVLVDAKLPGCSGDMDGLPKNSPNNMAGMNNPPGTPRDDGEMAGNFLNPFQSESYSPNMTMSV